MHKGFILLNCDLGAEEYIVDELKQMVKCPDCNMDMTQHILKYTHKRRGFVKL